MKHQFQHVREVRKMREVLCYLKGMAPKTKCEEYKQIPETKITPATT
jgi:hypothetical protein